MWERNIYRLPPCAPQPGTEPTTEACALSGNWTGDLSLCGTTPNQLSHSGKGHKATLSMLMHLFIYYKLLFDPNSGFCVRFWAVGRHPPVRYCICTWGITQLNRIVRNINKHVEWVMCYGEAFTKYNVINNLFGGIWVSLLCSSYLNWILKSQQEFDRYTRFDPWGRSCMCQNETAGFCWATALLRPCPVLRTKDRPMAGGQGTPLCTLAL